MVVYGSYLGDDVDIKGNAVWTVIGDTGAGLLAGLGDLPRRVRVRYGARDRGRVCSSPRCRRVFAQLPVGWIFGFLFFGGLFGAALLSGIAAYEVLVAGFTDMGWTRKKATWTVYAVSMVFALPPMINLEIFVPWDLTFGSGGQTLGALITVVTVGWVMKRATLLEADRRWRPLRGRSGAHSLAPMGRSRSRPHCGGVVAPDRCAGYPLNGLTLGSVDHRTRPPPSILSRLCPCDLPFLLLFVCSSSPWRRSHSRP